MHLGSCSAEDSPFLCRTWSIRLDLNKLLLSVSPRMWCEPVLFTIVRQGNVALQEIGGVTLECMNRHRQMQGTFGLTSRKSAKMDNSIGDLYKAIKSLIVSAYNEPQNIFRGLSVEVSSAKMS